ncbi:MAG: hypothetical protein PHV28_07970 [Kiritimatiellae bacterium]|jgi:hypothetical protein|nr:hypothetical protein [Kiritimatiellia bacterium]
MKNSDRDDPGQPVMNRRGQRWKSFLCDERIYILTADGVMFTERVEALYHQILFHNENICPVAA